MTPSGDRFWDDLGIAWRAADIQASSLMPRLRTQIARERRHQRAAVAIGVFAAICGVGIGIAWMMTNRAPAVRWLSGIVIAGLAAIIAFSGSLQRSLTSGDTASLIGMLDLAIAQAERRQRDAKAGYLASGIVIVVGASMAWLGYAYLHLLLDQAVLISAVVIGLAVLGSSISYREAQRGRERLARLELVRQIFLTRGEEPHDDAAR